MSLFDHYCPTHPLMAQAWVDCLRWSVTEPGMVAAFQAQTGCVWTPARTPIDQMIDAATGAEEALVTQYLLWFNQNVWGVDAEQEITP